MSGNQPHQYNKSQSDGRPASDAPRSYNSHQGTNTHQGSSLSSSSFTNAYASGPQRGMEGRGRGGYEQRYPNKYQHHHQNTRAHGALLMEDGPRTKLSSYVTPHDAVQAQPAQHGASIVRSGSSATEGGSILFFSSVQKKGGAFTSSERETYAQLRQSRAIPNSSNANVRGAKGGTVLGSGIQSRNVARKFGELEKSREAQELVAVKAAVMGSKRSRFNFASSDSEEEGSEEDDGETNDVDTAHDKVENVDRENDSADDAAPELKKAKTTHQDASDLKESSDVD